MFCSLESIHTTIEGLLFKEILSKVKLAGLADNASCELNPDNLFKLLEVISSRKSFSVVKLTPHSRVPVELLLQVNVILPLSGTTYPPGIGSASADRVTVKGKNTLIIHYTKRRDKYKL